MIETVDTVVIGAGVVGLACARALARAGREVMIIERHPSFGTETSSRNSEVIHAGIYYPRSSKKAQFCVRGKQLLYEFCREYDVPHQKIGKLIVATSATQLPKLETIKQKAEANGVHDLALLDADLARQLEPELNCVGALLSPSTGIVDSHTLMMSMLGDAERFGVMLAVGSEVIAGAAESDGILLEVLGSEQIVIRAKHVVNAAGLNATDIALTIKGMSVERVPQKHYAKGNYFALNKTAPFSRLIYPVPEQGGLGVHLTLDMAGQAKFGPDVEWVDAIDYKVDEKRGARFYEAIRTYWPGLEDGSLVPAYAGIRPKIVGPGVVDADFLIQGVRDHGIAGLINLFGIESPGLTSSLALAEYVVSTLESRS